MINSAYRIGIGVNALACLAISLCVSGCIGTSPGTRYYAFTAAELVGDNEGELKISVGPFVIPDYLDRPQIVVREQGTRLKVLQFDRWAEPLTDSITRRISFELSNELSSSLIYQFPGVTDISPDLRISGRIYNFEANTDGTVILRLRWVVLNRDKSFAIAPQGETFSTTIDSVEDVAAITNAMNGLLIQLAGSITGELQQIGVE